MEPSSLKTADTETGDTRTPGLGSPIQAPNRQEEHTEPSDTGEGMLYWAKEAGELMNFFDLRNPVHPDWEVTSAIAI